MKKRQIPHTYVIIFYIILFCAALTWVIPGGQYTENISPDGERTVVYESVESVPQTWEVLSAFYKGFVDKADIIVFILIIGGAFWFWLQLGLWNNYVCIFSNAMSHELGFSLRIEREWLGVFVFG